MDQVPRNSYDFSNLALDEETGYLSYKDTKGKVSAKKGIDVSEFQGETIDWQQVKESGIEFVIVRLGYRAYGESGALVEDAMFEQNVQGALDAGLEVGVYFFSQAISATEAVEETDFVLEHIQPYQISINHRLISSLFHSVTKDFTKIRKVFPCILVCGLS